MTRYGLSPVVPLLVWALLASSPGFAEDRDGLDPGGVLADYVSRADPEFEWRQRRSGAAGDGSEYVELILTSQTWRGIPWRHQLYLIRPSTLGDDASHALLMIGGGDWDDALTLPPEGDEPLPDDAALFVEIAEHLGAPVAVLRHVPQQPLFDGLREDELIAMTFEAFLETGDADWPLLLPMVKSAVRAMDAVQEYAARHWELEPARFTIIGASKRGWTTWLTGAVDDRVAAIAPIVIDMLDTGEYLRHAETVWGRHSEQIAPYTDLGLHEVLDDPARQTLLRIVDPFHYRAALELPKLIILSTNDEYWPLDSLNLYWDALTGEKNVLYLPNNVHRLDDLARVTAGVVGLHRHVAGQRPLPRLDWDYRGEAGAVTLSLRSDLQPHSVRIWSAESDTRDMRQAQWHARTVEANDGEARYHAEAVEGRYRALFAEVQYDLGDAPLFLSTTVRILPPVVRVLPPAVR